MAACPSATGERPAVETRLVVIDHADSAGKFAAVDESNRRLAAISVPAPPALGRRRFRGRSELEKDLGRSRFGPGLAEAA